MGDRWAMLKQLMNYRWPLMVGSAIALLFHPGLIPLAAKAESPVALSPAELDLNPFGAANLFFTFRDEPINPRAVGDLLPWLSDTEPGLVAVDVEGSMADTNRYWADVEVIEEGPAAGSVRAIWNPQIGETITYSTSYRWLGRLDNDLHILRVARNTGGSGVFTSLLFVRFSMDTEYYYVNGPGPRPRLIMQRMGSYGLGDRDGRSVQLEENSVVIEAGPTSGEIRIDLSDY